VGVVASTKPGEQVLARYPDLVDLRVLSQFPEARRVPALRATCWRWRCFYSTVRPVAGDDHAAGADRGRFQDLRAALVAELLDSLGDQDPAFFETLVLDVLQAMVTGQPR